MLRVLALAYLGLGAARTEDHWAVLIAGSNGFWNYRHQADVCHAYQVLTKRGFDPDKIITMMYDDVAGSRSNPFKGKLYNYPWKTMEEAIDVYEGCKIDYKGKDVTPEKFVAVLTGDAETAGGKVLQSTAKDHVFVNFVDHGGVGIIAFPGMTDVLHANKLVGTLKDMYQKQMYKQLSFYLETCESGSMFEGLLPESLPVYALTAANAKESSWGTYCGSASMVGGKSVGSCLGDLFSVNWMMDTESTHKRETLKQQYKRVKNTTNKSHVMQYGQVKKFDKEYVSDFQGSGSERVGASPDFVPEPHTSTVDSRNIKLDQLYLNYVESGSASDAQLLMEEIKARQAVQRLGSSIAEQALGSGLGEEMSVEISWTPEMLACHEQAVAAFGASCGWDEGRLVLSKTLYQLCDRTSGSTAPILGAVENACKSSTPEPRAELVV
mmetsp:Transcript_42348/g.106757  ORF Transcript_42348/g.106757 Transcript_42348/m.106757 type:complete len:438 (+) Transcript_42348:57-1370(+)